MVIKLIGSMHKTQTWIVSTSKPGAPIKLLSAK